MPTRDNKSDQRVSLLFNAAISTDTATNTFSVDTADFDCGVMLGLASTVYVDGTYVLSLEDSPDNSVWTAVAADKVNGSVSVAVITDATAGDVIETLGMFSTERYIRGVITSTATTTGATLNVMAIMKGEYNPQA